MSDGEQKIYIVTSGEYSDYRINAVFTDKALAENYVEAFNRGPYGDPMKMTEWVANNVPVGWAPGLKPFKVQMTKNGDVHETDSNPYDVSDGWQFVEMYPWVWDDPNRVLEVGCFARDKEHAIKIAAERWAKVKATCEWGVTPE